MTMRRCGLAWLLLVAVLVAPSVTSAGEQVDLVSPDQAKTGTLVYRVHYLMLDWQAKTITLALSGDNGIAKACRWTGATATTMMKALNKADLSVKSLVRRAYERAVTDGCLPAGATVSGAPD